MGNRSFCVPKHDLQVHMYTRPGSKKLLRANDPYAVWMKKHHGNLDARAQLPWQSGGPLLVAMWTIDAFHITIYVAELDSMAARICTYVVQTRGGVMGPEDLLPGVAHLSQSWRQDAFHVSTSGYLYAMHRLRVERGFFLLPKNPRRGERPPFQTPRPRVGAGGMQR